MCGFFSIHSNKDFLRNPEYLITSAKNILLNISVELKRYLTIKPKGYDRVMVSLLIVPSLPFTFIVKVVSFVSSNAISPLSSGVTLDLTVIVLSVFEL